MTADIAVNSTFVGEHRARFPRTPVSPAFIAKEPSADGCALRPKAGPYRSAAGHAIR